MSLFESRRSTVSGRFSRKQPLSLAVFVSLAVPLSSSAAVDADEAGTHVSPFVPAPVPEHWNERIDDRKMRRRR
jgi:hypothetical protein